MFVPCLNHNVCSLRPSMFPMRPNLWAVMMLLACVQFTSTEPHNSTGQYLSGINTTTPSLVSTLGVDNVPIESSVDPKQHSISTKSPVSRVYLKQGNLYVDSQNSNNSPNRHPAGKTQTSVHIYVIFFIGIMPAAIGAFAWWLQSLKNKCLSSKHSSNNSNDSYDVEKLSRGLMKRDKTTIDQLAYQIAKRAEKLSEEKSNLPYMGYKPNLIKSRRVYSLEVPRKCLEMIEVLGEGNFGQVWKARTYQFGNKCQPEFVAVKTNKVNASIEQEEDLLKELDIMLQLGSHPNVVRLMGCCTENEPYYLVMEYVSQGKLLSYLRHHRSDSAYYYDTNYKRKGKNVLITNNNYMTYCNNNAYGYSEINRKESIHKEPLLPYDLIHFAYQISKGMEFISSHGIIHRDLAARNILVDGNRNCKVADFGLSRSIRDKETDMYEMKHDGQMPIRWMSPEALSMGIFSIKSDVWAFGILMWEIVTLGSTPYIGMSAHEVINFIRQGNICSKPDHCSEDLYDLMKSCWAYKAEDRFTFTDIKHNLVKMLLDIKEEKSNYIDLEHFNDTLYYFNTHQSPDEKL